MKKAKITLDVQLDEDQIPIEIKWDSSDDPKEKIGESKAFLLSIFEKESLETLRIDLWTKELEVGEMNRLVYYTLKGLAETYHRATNDDRLANDLGRFAQYFGEETQVVPREKN